MKRNQEPKWREKLDTAGLEFLEGLRLSKRLYNEFGDTPETREAVKFLAQHLPGFGGKSEFEFTPELLTQLKADPIATKFDEPGKQELPPNIAKYLEYLQTATALLEDADLRKTLPSGIALACLLLGNILRGVRRFHFGDAELNGKQLAWAVGETLCQLGKSFQEDGLPDSGKGHLNLELIETIKKIRIHQKKKLTGREMLSALKYAGIHVSNEETLRVFEWRCRKKGLL